MFKTIILPIFLLGLISGCNPNFDCEKEAPQLTGKKVWIQAQIGNKEYDDSDKLKTEYYYYFGQVDSGLYASIINNQITNGFIQLSDVHYNQGDVVVSESDENKNYDGDLVFRISDLRFMRKLNVDHPKLIRYKEEQDSSAETSENEGSEDEAELKVEE